MYEPFSPKWPSEVCLGCGVRNYLIHEYYMIHDHLWLKVNPQDDGELCIGCVEHRLGRTLHHRDFTNVPVNSLRGPWSRKSYRLKSRLRGKVFYG